MTPKHFSPIKIFVNMDLKSRCVVEHLRFILGWSNLGSFRVIILTGLKCFGHIHKNLEDKNLGVINQRQCSF